MGRYTGPKAKINRALGMLIYENAGAAKALERRAYPPGMHVRKRPKPSTYGLAMLEKKKLKHYYGIYERQLKRYFDMARRQPGNTGLALLQLCERRLDNVVRRAGFTTTRPQARQGVAHGHFLVNRRKVDRPSFLVSVGDVITVRDRPNVRDLYRSLMAQRMEPPPRWLQVDPENLQITVTALPEAEDISLPIEVERVVELLSR